LEAEQAGVERAVFRVVVGGFDDGLAVELVNDVVTAGDDRDPDPLAFLDAPLELLLVAERADDLLVLRPADDDVLARVGEAGPARLGFGAVFVELSVVALAGAEVELVAAELEVALPVARAVLDAA
jgi:hypothetical protein